MASSHIVIASRKASFIALLAKIDLKRVLALAFPHWALWALTIVMMLADFVMDLAMPNFEISARAYSGIYLPMVLALPFVVWRYLRFDSVDWLFHRAWAVVMLILWVSASAKAEVLLTYVLTALRPPLASDLLTAADRAMGFDWNAYASLILSTPWSENFFYAAYTGVADKAIKAAFILALLINNRARYLEVAFLSVSTSVICAIIGGILPAYMAFNTVALQEINDHLIANQHYLDGVADEFTALRNSPYFFADPSSLVGLVSFPSYHTCVGLIVIICSRGLGWVSLLQALIGVCIIIATPTFGGHYLIDIIGGTAVMAMCFAIWHCFLSPRVSPALPGTHETDFGWPKNWHFARHFAYR